MKIRLRPKTVRRTALILLGAGAALALPGALIPCNPLLFTGLAVMLLSILFLLFFYRCPCCGRYLDRSTGDFCPYCGENIDRR